MTVTVDGRQLLAAAVSATSWTDYKTPATLDAGSHSVAVSFLNDFMGGGCDRNLYIDQVTFSQADAPAMPPATLAWSKITHPFAASSVWNTPVPTSPFIDPMSSAIEGRVLRNTGLILNVDLDSYGMPIYTATTGTPRVNVAGMAGGTGLVPLDPSWVPNTGSDHKIAVFDPKTSYVYELWNFDPIARTTGWGVKHNYISELGDGYAPPDQYHQSPTGAGVSQAAGVIRISDIQKGSIDHALAFVTSTPAANLYRYPASKTDGAYTGNDGLVEGMRVQLDPNLDVDAIPNIPPGERMIAKALQRYGAICMDSGGGNNQAMGFYAEKSTFGMTNPYPAAGFASDWASLPHIPRDRLHVLGESITPRP